MAATTNAGSAKTTAVKSVTPTVTQAAAAAAHAQIGLLNAYEVKCGELKILAKQIQAAGGFADSAANTDLTNLIALL